MTEEIELLSFPDKNEDDLAALHAIIERIFEDEDLKIPIGVCIQLINEVDKYL